MPNDNDFGDNVVDSDIAIIGMSCRFPGDINSPEEFWQFLLAGGDGIVPVPLDRWDNKAYYDGDKDKKNKMYVSDGGFIKNIDQFDPLFFGVSPKEAPLIDPQHRWLLELTHEVFENAGLKVSDLKGSNTAVYIGQFMHDYEQLLLDSMAHDNMTSHSATGPSMTLTSNRISYLFDFTGPSVTLDTACSSSLVALDFACKALLNGDSDIAIAGGVNILLRPELTMAICKASMLSPDCRCKSFDAAANGYVRSEGAGIVLIKKLSDAIRDGNNVLAVIKATGVNQDGQTVGITVPSGSAQEKLLLKSLTRAKVRPEEIQYAEAHGTGTAVGDPIEVNALGAVLGDRTTDKETCIIGSVKSNIGHTEAAAGMAGLMKTVLAMNHGFIPKNIHYHTTNPAIDLKTLNIRIASDITPWPETYGQLRHAVVNSFGFGGTNANVILQEPAPKKATGTDQAPIINNLLKLLPISSKTEKGLKDQATKFKAFFSKINDEAVSPEKFNLHDICYTASTKRDHHKHRLIVHGADKDQISKAFDDFISGLPTSNYVVGAEKNNLSDAICFVFSGMGTQWTGMGKSLYQSEPVFKAEIDRCDKALLAYTQWSLVDALFYAENIEKIHDTNIAQPGIFAIQIALAAQLKSWGIEPDVVVGHSAGEVGAAYIAGALSFDDAIKVIYYRSQLQHTTEGMGKMLAVGLTEAALQPYLTDLGNKVSIGAINSEDAITLSGDEDVLADIAERLEQQDIFARFLNVGVPYHSPVMDQLREPLIEALNNIHVQVPHTTLFSTVSGQLTQPGDWGAEYWADNVRDPVRFKDAIENILKLGVNTFIEIAPHGALSSSIQKNLQKSKTEGVCVATLKRDHDDTLMLMQSLATLHVQGVPIAWDALYPQGGQFASLPNYAWQHSRYWAEADVVQHSRLNNITQRGGFSEPVHPLLGSQFNSLSLLWQRAIDLNDLSYLIGHCIDQEIVYPGAAYIEMALAIARQELVSESITLTDVEFKKAFFLDKEKTSVIETTFDKDSGLFVINAVDPQTDKWSCYSQGYINSSVLARNNIDQSENKFSLVHLKSKFDLHFNREEFYKHCHNLGLTYLDDFQMVEQAWYSDNESLVEIIIPNRIVDSLSHYALHPVILDGAFQSLFPTIDFGYLPTKIAALHYYQKLGYQKPGSRVYAYLNTLFKDADNILGDITIFSADGDVFVEVVGAELKSTKTRHEENADSILYDFVWEKQPFDEVETVAAVGQWIIFVDNEGVGQQLVCELQYRGQSVCIVEKGSGFERVSNQHYRVGHQSADDLLSVFKYFEKNSLGIVYLWGIENKLTEDQSADVVFSNCLLHTLMPVYIAQAMDKTEWQKTQKLFFITQGVHPFADALTLPESSQAALWGFARVFAAEHPEYAISLIDLASSVDVDLIAQVAHQITHDQYEQEIAFLPGTRYVNRLRRLTAESLNSYAEHTMVATGDPVYSVKKIANQQLKLVAAPHYPPAINDVVIKVGMSNLSAEHVNQLMPQSSLGDKNSKNVFLSYICIGTVIKKGAEVKHLEIGDRIIAFVHGSDAYTSEITLPADDVMPCNTIENVDDVMALTTSFLTAYFGLNHLSQLQLGQRVLIHNAADGVGLAAVHLAKLKNATIYATANTLEKRLQLVGLGITEVFDTSSHSLNANIMSASQNKGVDLVVNTDIETGIYKTLSLLKPFGHWIDVGQLSRTQNVSVMNEIAKNNVSYHCVNISHLVTHRANLCMSLLQELITLFDTQKLTPALLTKTTLPSLSVNHLDEVVQLIEPKNLLGIALNFDVNVTTISSGCLMQPVNNHSSYLVTGGLGGLGLELMDWLAAQGAVSIVLIGRSMPSPEALTRINAIRHQGTKVEVVHADVTRRDDVEQLFSTIHRTMLPLAGIFHSAGVLDDGVITQQTSEKFSKVFSAKIKGAWNLHQLSDSIELDFFVCFSSIASIVGWAGQSNYAAANAFMDSLAYRRRVQGKSALTINWGPWDGSGMAANLDERDIQRMNNAGMTALTPHQGLTAMELLLRYRVPQAGIFELDWGKITASYSNPQSKTLFRNFINSIANKKSTSFIDRLLAAPLDNYETMLSLKVAEILANVLGIESLDAIDKDKNVFEYGMNSLMSMDFKNRLQSEIKLKLATTLVLKYPTVNTMTEQLVSMFCVQEEIVY
jgi:acyl transferase domain-containing protein/acyl carrier protein